MAYHSSALEARNRLVIALEEAKETLPAAILRLHWMAAKHSPAPWKSVEAHYVGLDDRDPQVLNTLTDLALMSEALACLITITTEQGTTGSLKLAKVRRLA